MDMDILLDAGGAPQTLFPQRNVMSKSLSSSNWFKTSLLAVALPLAAVAVLCADNLLAISTGSHSGPSLIMEHAKTWQDDSLDETLSAQYVELDAQNRLVGTVTAIEDGSGMTIPVPGLRVKLVQRSNEISNTLTDANGNFSTDALIPGSYTLCISGNEGFLAYGIQVIGSNPEAGEEFEMPDLQDAANGQPSNQKQLIRYRLVQDQPTDIKAAVIPPTHNALKEIINQIPADVGIGASGFGGNARINVEDSVVAGGFQVSLREDRTLIGRIAPLVSNQDVPVRLREMSVYLLQNDEIMGQVSADKDGNFSFNDVEPGVYGFAAAGRDGFAAISFQAIAASDTNASREPSEVFQEASAKTAKVGSTLSVALCPPEDIPFLKREINNLGNDAGIAQNAMPMDPMSSVPGMGGGGGGLGMGGFGGLLEAGIAAWLLTELINNENSNRQVIVPPVIVPPANSPFTSTSL